MEARVWALVSGLWSSVVCLSSDLQVFPNDDSVRCEVWGVDGGDDHLSLLDIRRVFFKVCRRAQSSGFRGSRLMELSSFSLFPSSSPYFPFLLVARPDAERNCPSLWLLYTSLC